MLHVECKQNRVLGLGRRAQGFLVRHCVMSTAFQVLSLVLCIVVASGTTTDRSFSILGYSPEEIESDNALDALYDRWCAHFPKGCSSWASNSITERQKRIAIFRDNLRFIDDHNRGQHSYWLGLNQFSDLTNFEFRQRLLGLSANASMLATRAVDQYREAPAGDIPDSIDWRTKGAVTAPKDQGSCGGCWAFSTTGAIEGINQIVTGNLISLSEQELVDCDRSMDNGCNGGLMEYAFQFVIKNGGLDTESDYPYKAEQRDCDMKKRNAKVVSIDSYKSIPMGDENSILKAVAKQPVSVAIEGGGREFQHYAGGVFTGPCGEDVNHGVLIVGYGSEDGLDYWIVKNSWGATWGEGGFVKMRRNLGMRSRKGLCSINTLTSFPVKTGDNPPSPRPHPPSPKPPPAPPAEQKCDKFQKCPAGTTCCCKFPVGSMCINWGCCKMNLGVCCPDHRHCCPRDYPVCKPSAGLCVKDPADAVGVGIEKSKAAIRI